MSRKVSVIFLMMLVLLFVSTAFGGKFKKYRNKSGMVEYKLSGNSEGKSVTYWDDYGYKEVQISETKTKIWGMTTVEKKTTLTLGSEIYEWKVDDENVYRTENPLAEMWEDEKYEAKDFEEFGKETMTQMGFEKIGDEKIDGRDCEVWKGMGKIWIWKKNGIAIKTDVKMMGINIISEAVNVKLDVKVDKDKFKYPKDRPIVDQENTPDMNGEDEEVDINALKNAMKMAGQQSDESSDNKKIIKKESDSDENKEEGNFGEELKDTAKEAAKDGAKEGAKEATKEEAKEASKKATKKLIKGLFGK